MEDVKSKVQKMLKAQPKKSMTDLHFLLIKRGVWGHVLWWDVWDKKKVMIKL